MTYLSRQELFNTTYIGLKSQGFTRSMDKNNIMCMYRGENNKKCGIGHAIPDDKYNIELEGTRNKAFAAANIDTKDYAFATDLQNVHDINSNPSIMKDKLHKFAKWHKLTIPE